MQQLIKQFKKEICLLTEEAEEAADITLKHMKGFAEWVDNKYGRLIDSEIWVCINGDESSYTTEQLIEKYFEKPNS